MSSCFKEVLVIRGVLTLVGRRWARVVVVAAAAAAVVAAVAAAAVAVAKRKC